jgi:hypothetical protein
VNQATAVYLNLTAIQPSRDGHVSLYASDVALPPPAQQTSVINFVGGVAAIGNGALVNLSASGALKAYVGAPPDGAVHITLDVLGYYKSLPGDLHFYGLPACRLLDTRLAPNPESGGPSLAHGVARAIKVQGLCGVPTGAAAATVTLTIVSPSEGGHLTAFPFGAPLPAASVINFPAFVSARANGTVVPLKVPADAAGWDLHVLAAIGTSGLGVADLLIDVSGYYKN